MKINKNLPAEDPWILKKKSLLLSWKPLLVYHCIQSLFRILICDFRCYRSFFLFLPPYSLSSSFTPFLSLSPVHSLSISISRSPIMIDLFTHIPRLENCKLERVTKMFKSVTCFCILSSLVKATTN